MRVEQPERRARLMPAVVLPQSARLTDRRQSQFPCLHDKHRLSLGNTICASDLAGHADCCAADSSRTGEHATAGPRWTQRCATGERGGDGIKLSAGLGCVAARSVDSTRGTVDRVESDSVPGSVVRNPNGTTEARRTRRGEGFAKLWRKGWNLPIIEAGIMLKSRAVSRRSVADA